MSIDLDILPTELWLEILLTLRAIDARDCFRSEGMNRSKRSIGNVSLSCRRLHQMVEPVMFRQLRFSGRSTQLKERTRNLLDLLRSRPDIHPWVQDLTIVYHAPAEDPDIAIEHGISEIFCMLDNLRLVHIEHLPVSTDMWVHLHRLQGLREVRFWNITLGEEAGKAVDPTELRLRDLIFNEVRRPDQTAIARCALSPTLERLHISWTMAPYVYSLPFRSRSSILSTLEVPEPLTNVDTRAFYEFGQHHPAITTIRLTRRFGGEPQTLSPDPHVFSNLHTVQGAVNFVKLLVPGRPVEDIEVSGSCGPSVASLSKETLIPLSLGTAPLRRLHLNDFRWVDGCFEAMVDYFPFLEDLVVWVKEVAPAVEWIEGNFKAQAARLQQAATLRLYSKDVPATQRPSEILEREKRLLEGLRESNPRLVRVGFWGKSAWRWRHTADNPAPHWTRDSDP